MDYNIGRVLEALEAEDQYERTIVLFTSDNGPWYKGSPGTFRGRKGQSYEGGYRVPLIAKWDGHIEAGSTSSAPVMNIDLYPTLLHIAGLENPHDRLIDGRSILPLLMEKSDQSPHDHLLFFHYNDIEAVRAGSWKYFDNVSHYTWPVPIDKKGTVSNSMIEPWVDSQSPNLYNIELDPGENYDLIVTFPHVGDSLDQIIADRQEEFNSNPEGWL
jgi:uncharacterized sulfatase